MNWLKKNLFLVVGGVVALGLLGFAIFFLLNQKQAVDEVTAELNTQTEELKRLANRDPHPNQENVERARHEQKKITDFLQQARKFFMPAAAFTNMDSATFKSLLETTIADLVHDADKAGVNLPSKYDFTFKPQRSSIDFAADTLLPLAEHVMEIKAICDILFEARIHTLAGLRRVPVAKQDEGPADYLVGKKPATNAVTAAVLTPYEIQFQGFSAELAAVLEGFYRATNCFIVRNVDVQTNVVNLATEAAPTMSSFLTYPHSGPTSGAPRPTQSSMDDLMQRRYGIGRYSRPIGPPPAQPPGVVPGAAALPARRGPETILDERPLRITMYIEAVRLTERARPKSAK